MPHHSQTKKIPAPTEGRLIRWASYYDALTNMLVQGQARR